MLSNTYKGRKVLVTGHTGFKGSWLSLWLIELGADVVGISSYLPSDPCNYDVCNLGDHLTSVEGDVRNRECLETVFREHKPEIVFHLAAQPIVMRSLEQPRLTFETNVMGTINIIESIRNSASVKAGVLITSDKCYENMEWQRGYHEEDRLGGKDPYSASKACAEVAFSAYARSFFADGNMPSIATARAGNVIGGGDWASDRIVPDCVTAISRDEKPVIRNPNATRPWQHVFEPLSGYLLMGRYMLEGNEE
ncbi:MAG: CDP-glucose 4,6-dehydratase, partial [Thermoplasmata archaeon]|nr:CDP-glucose 4,6-dehydratase [Thermoplasmata archaeon]